MNSPGRSEIASPCKLTRGNTTKPTWRDPDNVPIVSDCQVRRVGGLEVFVGAVVEEQVWSPEVAGSQPDVLNSKCIDIKHQ